jgi:hypothetical protein
MYMVGLLGFSDGEISKTPFVVVVAASVAVIKTVAEIKVVVVEIEVAVVAVKAVVIGKNGGTDRIPSSFMIPSRASE